MFMYTHTCTCIDILTPVCSMRLCGGRGECMFFCIPDPVLVDDDLAGTT